MPPDIGSAGAQLAADIQTLKQDGVAGRSPLPIKRARPTRSEFEPRAG